MRIKLSFPILAPIMVGMILIACNDEVGPQGPKGDMGQAGTAGALGAKGDKGDTGDPGEKGSDNGNIIVDKLEGGQISEGTNGSGYSWWYDNDWTADVVEASAVHVYLQMPSGIWYALPGAVLAEPGNTWQTFALRVTIEENRTRTRFRITRTEGAGALTFSAARIIMVPKTAGARMVAVDYTDYNAVKKYYNLDN
jgi:hypothetical protein